MPTILRKRMLQKQNVRCRYNIGDNITQTWIQIQIQIQIVYWHNQ